MRSISFFLILTIASLASLALTVVVGVSFFASTQTTSHMSSSGWGNMWNSMMGGPVQEGNQNAAAAYFAVVFAVTIAVAIIGVAGLAYFHAFPKIRTATINPLSNPTDVSATVAGSTSDGAIPTAFESVMKTLNSDERKVVETLQAHNGKYLQKYIRSETGLSRLQTHRVVARLAERGIVGLEKTGNTNTVTLASWLE